MVSSGRTLCSDLGFKGFLTAAERYTLKGETVEVGNRKTVIRKKKKRLLLQKRFEMMVAWPRVDAKEVESNWIRVAFLSAK